MIKRNQRVPAFSEAMVSASIATTMSTCNRCVTWPTRTASGKGGDPLVTLYHQDADFHFTDITERGLDP